MIKNDGFNKMSKYKYLIVSGSSRKNSQSKKVSDYIFKSLAESSLIDSIHMIDLAKDMFPLWDETFWNKENEWNSCWSFHSNKIKESDAIIIISPEWNGMVPPHLTNFFQLCTNQEISHKPGLIVSVSSGQGGSYPVAELRSGSFKNTKICYLPEHLIIREVTDVLNDPENSLNDKDKYIRERLHYTLSLLNVYASAFKEIRKSEIITNSNYPYGM